MTRRTNHAHADDQRRPGLDQQLAGTMFAPATEPPPPAVRLVEVRAHTRTATGPARPGPDERKAGALEKHEGRPEVREAIVYIRARLLELYRRRHLTDPATAEVTADDADEIIRAWPHFPVALRTGSQNWRGTIFRGRGWERTGRRFVSKRGDMHAHDYPTWRPVL